MWRGFIIIFVCLIVVGTADVGLVKAQVSPSDLTAPGVKAQEEGGTKAEGTPENAGSQIQTPLEFQPIVGLPGKEKLKQPASLTEYISVLYTFLLTFAGIAAVVMIIFGGVQYMLAGISPSQLQKAKDRIIYAVGGLILAMVSFLILETINPDLLSLRFSVEKVEVKTKTLKEKEAVVALITETKQADGSWKKFQNKEGVIKDSLEQCKNEAEKLKEEIASDEKENVRYRCEVY